LVVLIETKSHKQFQPGTYLDNKESTIKYSDFINKELILFSMADLQRSIPSVVDGLKPGQRKILFCSFKRNLIKDTKVLHSKYFWVFFVLMIAGMYA
jgi:DNA gyrase/topoisomerase IV subunit A